MKMRMPERARIRGLYAITPDLDDTAHLCTLIEASLDGGAALVQYRNKNADAELRATQAGQLLALCRRHGVPLIINDHADLCLALGADGVHLGRDDGDIASVRAMLGDKLLGVSCYASFEQAQSAQAQGADYVAFGSCFGSNTKPDAVRAPLALFTRATRELTVPVVAIGGITADNARLALDAGADSIAVIDALFGAANVQQAATRFSTLFQ
jgi:thiamine-phosphate pyrophosphorylase